jgi:SAM-dependent methyltransferase
MEPLRKPLQGVGNIIRFNWPFFAAATVALAALGVAGRMLPEGWALWAWLALGAGLAVMLIPLGVAVWIYDTSGLYQLPWLKGVALRPGSSILNIHSGFDETSELIRDRFPEASLTVLDFYDPDQHTEASIRRARAAYPPSPETVKVTTTYLPVPDGSADLILLTFAAHEVRDDAERATFFKECRRVLAGGGQIVVTEHLRDWPNFLAWNAGVFHFHSRQTWEKTFEAAGLRIVRESRHTPFVTHFYLKPASHP